MWARVVEFMLALWLAISPFIFGYPDSAFFFLINDFSCSTLLAFFSLICYYKPFRKMHLLNLLIACYLIALAYIFKQSPHQALLQNYMVIGLLLLMIGLVPTESEKPPHSWRDFYKNN